MAEHAGGEPCFSISEFLYMCPDPAQIDIERPNWPAAQRDAGGGAVVGDGIDDPALILEPRIDDLNCRNDIFGGAQYVWQDQCPDPAVAFP